MPTGDIENTDLAEHCAAGQSRKHGRAVVGDDRQLAALDDVQLLADVALAADVVAGTERRRAQLEHELRQQAGLALAKDGHSTQRVGVHVPRNLGPDALRQVTERHLFVHRRLAAQPQVVEPRYRPAFQTTVDVFQLFQTRRKSTMSHPS